MSWYKYKSNILVLKLYVQPGAKRHEVIGPIQDKLKIKLASQAIEGRANIDLIKFLATLFKVPKSNITLKSGEKSRHKTIEINKTNISPESIVK